ncbi:hypothetical protein CYMTET_35494 [Cymbomonas tetramitiformis]|uniref:Uncharacterized protein n=1 Tax=Cymbomonas tetramitiformis TaxID=36881 RepID=A0AAE0KP52_9CHLO|nr:hypothetical protein CYMTET_35494 [Cymbomonas tetramitiformis]
MDVESLKHFENALQMLIAEGRQVAGSASSGSPSEHSQQALACVREGIAAWRQERQLLQASMAHSNMKMAELQGTVKLTLKESDTLRQTSQEKDAQIKSLSESIQQMEKEVLLLRSTPSSPAPPADPLAERRALQTQELEEKNNLLRDVQTELQAKLASALSSAEARELSMAELQAQLARVEQEMAQVKEQHAEEMQALRAEPKENAKEASTQHPTHELKQWLSLLQERSKDGGLPVDHLSEPELEALREVQGMMAAVVPSEGAAMAITAVSQADLELEEQKLKVQELEITVQWREEELAEATRQQEAAEQRVLAAAEHTAALQDGRMASSQRALEESHFELDTMRKTMEELQAQVEEREALIQDKEEECSRYEAKMYHKDAMIKAMRRDSVVAMQEVEKAREQVAQEAREDEDKAITQRMSEQLSRQNESLKQLRDEAAQLRETNHSLQSPSAGMETSTQTTPRKDEPVRIETESDSSSKTLMELANRIKERDAKLASQAEQLHAAEREVDQMITWMSEGEQRLVTVEEHIFEKVEKLQEALAGAEAAAANADTKVAATKEEIAEANATTSLAAATAGMMQVKLSELESTVSEQEEQVKQAQLIYQAQVEENNKLQRSAQALEAEKAELLTNLASCEQSSNERFTELQTAAMEIENLQQSVLSLKSERGMVMKEDTDLKLNLLRRGGLFIKHNHHGRGSHERYVWITEDMDTICWGTRRGGAKRGTDPLGSTTKTHPSSSTLPVSLISKVVKGKSTAVTMALGRRVETDTLLSLESPMRTLDLQLPAKGNGLNRDQWASLFEWILARHKTSDGVMQNTSPQHTPRLHSNKLFEVDSTPATTQGTPSVQPTPSTQPQVTPSTGVTGVQGTPSILSEPFTVSTVGADAQMTPGPMS